MSRQQDDYQDNAADLSYDELKERLSELSSTVEEFVNNSGDDANEKVSALRERAQTLVANTKDYLANASEQLRDKGRDSAACADEFVHKNPWTCIGIGAAVGMAIGVIAGRR